MPIDEKTFFMEGALKICSYLEIENAMFACLDTIRKVMPVNGMYMQYYEPELNALRIAARATDEGERDLMG